MFFDIKIIMKKDKFTESKAENNPNGGVLVGKRQGQTIIHDKGTLSGYLVGKTHAEGGIKAINKSTGQPLEMQGGEVVITAPAVSDNSKNEFNGKMMTNREILSQINVNGGGVAFAEDGMEIPTNIKPTGASYNFGGKTMTDHEIIYKINGGGLNKLSEKSSELINDNYAESFGFYDFDWNKESERKDFNDWLQKFTNSQFQKNLNHVVYLINEDIELLQKRAESEKKLKDFEELVLPTLGNDVKNQALSVYQEIVLMNAYVTKEELKDAFTDKGIFDENGSIDELKIENSEIFTGEGINLPAFEKFVAEKPEYKGVFDYWKKMFDENIELVIKETHAYRYPSINDLKMLKEELTNLDKTTYDNGGEVVTYRNKYNKKYGYSDNDSHSLEEISKDTGVSMKGLQKIYNKGIGAYKTNPSSVRPNVKSKEKWAMARVYSSVMGGKASEIDANELKMNTGGNVNLVSESKKGDHTSRDLNNYNDLLDVGADGQVGMENGLTFEDGGDVDCYADGGATLSAEVFEWDKVPANYKNTSKVKKVPFINNPLDKGLDSIIAPFLGKDDLRPVMSGINFDENGITGTNAHILITLPYPNKKYEGVYDVNKAKKTKSDELLLINEKYPNYQAVIPKIGYGGIPYQVDVYKLLQYTKTAMNYSNKTTHAIAFKYGEDERIGFNGKFLSIVLTTALKLGHEKIYVFIESRSRAIVLSPNKNYELGNDELLLTMPVMLEANDVSYIDKYGTNDPDYNRSLKAYFDFNDSEIHNADGSVAEFKMQYENNLSVDDSYLALLTKITRKQYNLPILSYAKVQNGKMTATDLDVSLIVKNVNMPDGIYEIVNKAPNITMNPIEDFPRERVFDKDEYTSRGNSDTRKNTSFQFVTFSEVFEFYLEKLLLSVGNDDLRPVMSGICIKKTWQNQLFLISTNAHTLCKINITEYCEFNKDDRELEYILPVDYLKDFVKLADGSLHFKCSLANIFIEAENLEFIARAIDGNYPNYEAVIPKENNKKIVFDHAIMNKCLKSEKYTSLVAKYKDNKKVNYHIFNSGDKLYIKAYEMVGNQIQTIEDVEFCSVNIDYSETNKRITENDSLFLLMPVMTATTTPDRYFAFSKYYFDVMLKTITDTEVECYFTEPNRAYIFPIDSIDYKKTLRKEKTKQQKLSKADLKMIEEMETIQSESNELQDAIETLIMMLETAKGKDKREIKEALEVLQMLNEK